MDGESIHAHDERWGLRITRYALRITGLELFCPLTLGAFPHYG